MFHVEHCLNSSLGSVASTRILHLIKNSRALMKSQFPTRARQFLH